MLDSSKILWAIINCYLVCKKWVDRDFDGGA